MILYLIYKSPLHNMQPLPSDLYNYNILLRLPIKDIYRFCLAGKTNYAYCDDVVFWRRYFKDMSHKNIQKIIKNAANEQLFSFVNFMCENYAKMNILLDIRTLVYSYYYFAQQNNKYATQYLYNYLKNKYAGKTFPKILYKRKIYESLHEYTLSRYGLDLVLPSDIHKILKSLKTVVTLFKAISINANKKSINHITTIYTKLYKKVYPKYIAEYIVENTNDINWINILQINISTRLFDNLLTEIFGYLVYIGYDVSPIILPPTVNTYKLVIFIQNCDYDSYISVFGDNKIPALEYYNLIFRSKYVYKIYSRDGVNIRLLLDSYTILSPEETVTEILKFNKPVEESLDSFVNIASDAILSGYNNWGEHMIDIINNMMANKEI